MLYLKIAIDNIFFPLKEAKTQEDVTNIILENKDEIVKVYKQMIKETVVHDEGYKLFIDHQIKNWKEDALKTTESTYEYAIRTLMFMFMNKDKSPELMFEAQFCPMVRFAYETYIKMNNKK